MGPLSDDCPKCMFEIAGRPLLDWTVERLRRAGCERIVVVRGYMGDRIDRDDVVFVENPIYGETNILHSLMHARDFVEGDVIVSYSDIWIEQDILSALTADGAGQSGIRIAADVDWQPYYDGRTEHPLNEAEKAFIADNGEVQKIGKHLSLDAAGDLQCGEFLGLWAMDSAGSALFSETFNRIDAAIGRDDPFQNAAHWRLAYITDILQEIIDRGGVIKSIRVERGWAELDTQQDIERLPDIAARQRLDSLVAALQETGE